MCIASSVRTAVGCGSGAIPQCSRLAKARAMRCSTFSSQLPGKRLRRPSPPPPTGDLGPNACGLRRPWRSLAPPSRSHRANRLIRHPDRTIRAPASQERRGFSLPTFWQGQTTGFHPRANPRRVRLRGLAHRTGFVSEIGRALPSSRKLSNRRDCRGKRINVISAPRRPLNRSGCLATSSCPRGRRIRRSDPWRRASASRRARAG